MRPWVTAVMGLMGDKLGEGAGFQSWRPASWRPAKIQSSRDVALDCGSGRGEPGSGADSRSLKRRVRYVTVELRCGDQAGGVTENNQSTDAESPSPPPPVCMSIHPEGKSCPDLGSSACSQ